MASVTARQAVSEDDGARWGSAYVALIREWLARGGTAWLPLSGDSMAPVFPAGTRVLLASTDGARVSPGDVVVYEVDGGLVCHRVLRRSASGDVFTRGDAWRAIASWIPGPQILGKVVAVERRGVRVGLDTRRGRLAARLITACSLAFDRIVPPLRTLRWRVERSWR